MIADEIKERKLQLDVIKIELGNNMNKRERIPIIKKKTTPASHNAYDHEHLNNIRCTKILDMRIQGCQKRPNERV